MLIFLHRLGFCLLLAAKGILLMRLLMKRNCAGISGKTQLLYAIIFIARYIDIFANFSSGPELTALPKFTLIALSYGIVLLMFFCCSESYQIHHDKFRIDLLIVPCLVLSMLANYGMNIVEVMWSFSVFLESVAILPQLYMISKQKRVESIVYHYITLLAVSKMLLLIEGIYSQMYYVRYADRISLAAGIIQLMFYFDFFSNDLPLMSAVQPPCPTCGRSQDEPAEHGDGTNGVNDVESGIMSREAKEQEALRSAAAAVAAAQGHSQEQHLMEESCPPPYEAAVVLNPATLLESQKEESTEPTVIATERETKESEVRVQA
ncbi:hypothetical protein QAD02_018903 [Eretmocerus hayati]|uniref:Uncharacterized protein n=1 Tax=Eretmocerus hayati TaxID=131215 RepID=A0ACC2PJU7_9HYME|nr:hypothetical protein QAD02_018903 [Eretmocerus hayati]